MRPHRRVNVRKQHGDLFALAFQGALRGADLLHQMRGRIRQRHPLLISGRYDEAAPSTVQPFADAIPDVRWHIFEESSHVPHIEERDAYMALVQQFIDEHDNS